MHPTLLSGFLLLVNVKYCLQFACAILTGTGLPKKFQDLCSATVDIVFVLLYAQQSQHNC